MKSTGNKSEASILRQKAEVLLKKKSLKSASQLSEHDVLKLIHELEVRQIELELQNEELKLAKLSAQDTADKYAELYDFGQTGYFVLSKESKIKELNLSGANMLGKKRSGLINSQFDFFISNDTKPIFNLFLEKVFNSKTKEFCEVTLSTKDNLQIYIQLIGNLTDDAEHCLVYVINVTERKRLVEDLVTRTRISSIFSTIIDDQMFNEVSKVILEVMQSPFGLFGYIEEDGTLVIPTMTRQIWDMCQVPEKTIRFPRETWSSGSWSRVLREKATLYSNEPSTDIPEGHISILRHISLPILFHEEVIGLFLVANKEKDYSETDIRILTEIAGYVAPLMNARLQRERAQNALRMSEEKYRNLFNNSELGMFRTRLDGSEILEFNEKYLKILNYTLEEIKGSPSWNMWADERERDEMVQLLKAEGRVTDFECGMLNKQGEVRRCITSLRLYHDTGILEGSIQDITERKREEEELRQSEEKYKNIFENIQDVYYETSIDGTILEVSPSIEELSNHAYKREELIGKSIYDFYFNRKERDVVIEELKNRKRIMDYAIKLKNSDGSVISCSLTSKIQFDADGKPEKIIGTLHNVNERKLAELALIESEAKYRTMVTQSPDGIFIVDFSGYFLSVNKAMCDNLKYSEEEFLSMKIWDIVPQKYKPLHLKRIAAILKGEFINDPAEYEIKGKDGIVHFIEIQSAPYYHDKKMIGFQGVARDITERKRAAEELRESESSLRNAQKIANMGSWEWDIITQKTNWSENYFAILGFKPAEVEPSFELFRNRIHPDDVHFLDEMHANIMKDKTTSSLEFRLNQTDGKVKWIQNNISPVIEDGKLVKLKGTIIDITDRKQREDELRELNVTLEQRVAERTNELEIANKELAFHVKEIEQYTHLASHDLQEPLRTLTSFAQLIKEDYAGKLGEDGNKYVEFIYNSATRMRELVKGLLDYSQLGKERDKTTIDCNKIVREVFSDMHNFLEESGTNIIVQELPILTAYETEMRLLFQNLINNAIKFRKKEISPEIKISVVSQEKEWIFSIEDNGIGIDEKDQDRIFIMFNRLQKQSEYEGSGIGLAHCKKIVELHGGRIWVESTPGTGSKFIFTIPKQ